MQNHNHLQDQLLRYCALSAL